MKKQISSFPFVSLSDRSLTNVLMHRQIYEKMRQAILKGELPDGLLQAPATRAVKTAAFSRELNLSRQGVQMAEDLDDLLREHSADKFVPFQNGLTAIESFPFDTWARIAWVKLAARARHTFL